MLRKSAYETHIVRETCLLDYFERLLETKSSVALYVTVHDEGPRHVYKSVGYQGIGQPVVSMGDWVEIGFQDTDLGCW
jgi:predicted GNAT family acetyltransferase